MAENIASERNGKSKSSHRKHIRIDLTPMVDLGFLLITFFVFTSAMSAPKAMAMLMPDDKGKINDAICESCAITIIPAAANKIYYYEGMNENAIYKRTSYDANGLRALLVQKKKKVAALGRDAILIIKPSNSSAFRDLVNIIDEGNICMYKRYYLDNLTSGEEKKLLTLYY